MSHASPEWIVNIAAYRFVRLNQLKRRRKQLLALCRRWQLKGSILLSTEGINLFLAGGRESVDALVTELRSWPPLRDLETKESLSQQQPFRRLLVKIKRELIAFGIDGIDPAETTSPKLAPVQLKQWLDEGRPIHLLDVRNEYEVQLGTFESANSLGIDHFRQFPEASRQIPDEQKQQPLVMFCTGGIRCEKAGPFLERQGFTQVYQLDGGILKYLEECGGAHYRGECFVFDQRVALDHQLRETATTQCYACQAPLTLHDQQSEKYVPGKSCPHCFQTDEQAECEILQVRHRQLAAICRPLPGSVPYTNRRAIHIPAEADGLPLIEFLQKTYTFVPPGAWQQRFEEGLLVLDGQPVVAEHRVRPGERYEHWFPGTLEPPVNAEVRILHEDAALVVVNKPAPLPMHPCGRFNRNTLTYLLGEAYRPHQLRLAHRLDANTSGVVLFSRTRQVARRVQPQFSDGKVGKQYVCRVQGHPRDDEFVSTAAISARSLPAGARTVGAVGLAARTEFRVLDRWDDGTALVEACPITGRTNQIRLHLWDLGLPICGDPTYLPGRQIRARQTLRPDDPPLCLHAQALRIVHPLTGRTVEYSALAPSWAR